MHMNRALSGLAVTLGLSGCFPEVAYKGDLDFHYDDEGYFLRATWSREV